MTVKIVSPSPALTRRAARRKLGRCALAVIGASFAASSISAFGADLATGSFWSVTGPSQATHADHRSTTVQPSAPPDTKLDYLAAHARVVDQLYEELMRWTPPGCSSRSADASMAGRC